MKKLRSFFFHLCAFVIRCSDAFRRWSRTLDPVRSQIRAPVFFCCFWQWSSITIQNSDGSDGRRGRASASHISLRSFFLLSFPWLCVCIILVVSSLLVCRHTHMQGDIVPVRLYRVYSGREPQSHLIRVSFLSLSLSL